MGGFPEEAFQLIPEAWAGIVPQPLGEVRGRGPVSATAWRPRPSRPGVAAAAGSGVLGFDSRSSHRGACRTLPPWPHGLTLLRLWVWSPGDPSGLRPGRASVPLLLGSRRRRLTLGFAHEASLGGISWTWPGGSIK